jgi:hypothetical protein
MLTTILNGHRFNETMFATSPLVVEAAKGMATMDYSTEGQPTWEAGRNRLRSGRVTDGYSQQAGHAVDQTIARAIRDATQRADPELQQEAAAWLWICCPDVAEQVELPELHYDSMPALAAAYTTGDAGATSWLT